MRRSSVAGVSRLGRGPRFGRRRLLRRPSAEQTNPRLFADLRHPVLLKASAPGPETRRPYPCLKPLLAAPIGGQARQMLDTGSCRTPFTISWLYPFSPAKARQKRELQNTFIDFRDASSNAGSHHLQSTVARWLTASSFGFAWGSVVTHHSFTFRSYDDWQSSDPFNSASSFDAQGAGGFNFDGCGASGGAQRASSASAPSYTGFSWPAAFSTTVSAPERRRQVRSSAGGAEVHGGCDRQLHAFVLCRDAGRFGNCG